MGSKDGYIRKFDPTSKNDDIGGSDEAISSYMAYPITELAEGENQAGKLIGLKFEPAGGGIGGSFSDTDGFTWHVYSGRSAEEVLEKLKATTAWADSTVYAVGDLVTYSSVEYICITAHTSDTGGPPFEEPDTNTTDWKRAMMSTGSITGLGLSSYIRPGGRGAYFAVKLSNSALSETFAINKVLYSTVPVGMLR